jgi:chaperone BCS1
MTTNHIEKLDPALLRPGRCDMKVKLNNASHNQMENMFNRFFPDAANHEAEAFAMQLPEHKISMAKL